MDKTKEYNKAYYEQNKSKILEMLQKKESCVHCGRSVAHQNMITHQKSNYCKSRHRSSELTDMEALKMKVIELEQKLQSINMV
jgi:hypothetical protein